MREIGISPRFSRDKFVPLQTKQRYSTRDISGEVSLTLFFRGFVPFLSLADFVSRNKNLQVADLQRLKSCFGELVTATTRSAHIATDGTASEERKLACALPSRDGRRGNAPTKPKAQKEEDSPHWYALRTTYGREKKAYDYMAAKGITAFYSTTDTVKFIKGKRKVVTESRLPNIFFAYGTEEQLKSFVYDNVNLPFLRFYYRHVHVGRRIEKIPMIVPDYQMESLKIICAADADNTIVSLAEVPKFEKGQLVRVIDGAFKGVVGRVARWQGQQRVGVCIEEIGTIATAYIPNAFIEIVKK